MKRKINLLNTTLDFNEINAIKKVIKNNYLTENVETKIFENNFRKKFKIKNIFSISNWTSGILIILKNLNLKKDDQVIVPNITYFTTLSPIIWCNAKVLLCDIDTNTLSLDLEKLKKKITKKTKAIITAHLSGYCCEMDELINICKKKKIILIEDSAQALGAYYKKKQLGTLGDYGGFSFYGNKIITTGEGGIVYSKSKKNLLDLKKLKNAGRKNSGTYHHDSIGLNFRFTEIQAAIGSAQIKKIKTILIKKKLIYEYYKKKLVLNNQYAEEFKNLKNNQLNYWISLFRFKNKNKLKKYLQNNGIQVRDYFLPLNKQPSLKNSKHILNLKEKFPISEYVYKKSLILPSGPALSPKELKFICDKIVYFYNNKRKF